jgi:hypothetical protein
VYVLRQNCRAAGWRWDTYMYYVMRSKNEVLCAAAGRLAAERRFLKWCVEKKVTVYSENVLLAYFSELAKNMKSCSLWSHYSMINALLNIKKNVNITKYLKLRAFLKKQGEDYRPKKAKVLTKEQFDKFMFDASDEKYLTTKVKITMFYFVLCTKSPI